jgi:tetratricopeptide (TPR) repeat protein
MTDLSQPDHQNDERSTSITSVSGGVNVEANEVTIGGDVVGRDKVSSTHNTDTGGGANIGGNVTMSEASEFVGRDKIVNNIRQFILSPWGLIGLAVIFAVTTLIITGVIKLPAPLAFSPAKAGESLIIVANFEDRSGGKYQGIDPAQYVYEQLAARAKSDKLDVRVERLRQVVDDNTARTIGNVYSATLILWGWYDVLTITPRIEQIRVSDCCNSTAGEKRFSIADSSRIEFTIVQDLPSYTTYLVLFMLGLDRSTHDDLQRALDYFQAAITYNGNVASLPEIYLQRGNVYYRIPDFERAIADYDKAIQLNPADANAFNNRGVVYAARGDYSSAVADLTQAIQLEPDNPVAYYSRGNVYVLSGGYDEAIADLDKVLQLRPDSPETYFSRGRIYTLKGDLRRAKTDLEAALRLSKDPVLLQQASAILDTLNALPKP